MHYLQKLANVIFLVFCLSACLPSARKSRKKTGTLDISQNNDHQTPLNDVKVSETNFFKQGNTQTTSVLEINGELSSSFYLRGSQIHNFIKSSSERKNKNYCLQLTYPSLSNTPILLLTAVPKFEQNSTLNQIEYYYSILANDESVNKAICNPDDKVGNYYYSFSTICSTACTSSGTKLIDPNANVTLPLTVNHLSIKSIPDSQMSDNPTNSCSNSTTCLGFDCCLEGQCVTDKSPRPGVNTQGLEYLQALADIELNPEHIINYSETIFFLCPTDIARPPSDTEEEENLSTEEMAKKRLIKLSELKDCVNPPKNEIAICTKTFTDVAFQITPNEATTALFATSFDDRNFHTTYSGQKDQASLKNNSIAEVIWGGLLIYKEGIEIPLNNTTGATNIIFSTGNDNFLDKSTVKIVGALPTLPANNDLKIKFMVDGSCEKVSNTLTKCKKYYVQGQNSVANNYMDIADDHYPSSNVFKLPSYADLGKNINVTVDDIDMTKGNASNQWQSITTPKSIKFGDGSTVSTGQKIVIEFYTDISYLVNGLRDIAQNEINTICGCQGRNCNLTEKYNSSGEEITDYTCVYPPINPGPPPLQQVAIVGPKSVPVRFFDSSSAKEYTSFNEVTSENIPSQEGHHFSYVDSNRLKPNNVGKHKPDGVDYIGFNEIYGTINATVTGSPQMPTTVNVIKNRTYIIDTAEGTFQTCANCGTDYYDTLKSLFPGNFNFKGGGYMPDHGRTSRRSVATDAFEGSYRADDLIFGRACFVPVTMIPWTHRAIASDNAQGQRINRMQAQHFLFANGYNRDWYGFDYGALIGSFDGIAWFAIGNERKIRARSNRLFLAINAYFGDLSSGNEFTVTVTDSTSNLYTPSSITTSFQSDGAECQKYHQCQTDSDCIAQVGWDYVCENVQNLKTSWPATDVNGNELANSAINIKLKDILDEQFMGSPSRCVYRGRGSICHSNYSTIPSELSYSQTKQIGLNACNSNNYCQSFTDNNGTPIGKFNNKIVRYNASPSTQNSNPDVPNSETGHTFGLAARIIGRPYNYSGNDVATSQITGQLSRNNVFALCLPGRDTTSEKDGNDNNLTFEQQHQLSPNANNNGDQVLGIGMSRAGEVAMAEYLSSCAILDHFGNYIYKNSSNKKLNDSEVQRQAGTQSISTNSLTILESSASELVTDFNASIITKPKFQKNRCLRAPGSVCHTDLDCAANWKVTALTSVLVKDDVPNIDERELNFWQETLVCGNKRDKNSVNFDLKENRCCRMNNKTLTIPSDIAAGANINTDSQVAGIDYNITAPTRNSRISTVYSDMLSNPSRYPALMAAPKDLAPIQNTDLTKYDYQWKTFDAVASRSCCSGHWVRNFAKDNGNNHTWVNSRAQSIEMESLECLNYAPINLGIANTNEIYMRNISATEANIYLDWFATLELLGIPQIQVKSNHEIYCAVNLVNRDDGDEATTSFVKDEKRPLPRTIASVDNTSYEVLVSKASESQIYRYSAHDADNFIGKNGDSKLKMIFSPDKVSCCKPVNSETSSSDGADCCTGTSTNNRCCLPDYTDVTVYLNRFVSSEASHMADNLFDPQTGYLKHESTVSTIANAKNICCSGIPPQLGIAISNLKPRDNPESCENQRRFVSAPNHPSDSPHGEAQFFKAGMRWNNHYYCVPAGQNYDNSSSSCKD